jgi:hypothetical protein
MPKSVVEVRLGSSECRFRGMVGFRKEPNNRKSQSLHDFVPLNGTPLSRLAGRGLGRRCRSPDATRLGRSGETTRASGFRFRKGPAKE